MPRLLGVLLSHGVETITLRPNVQRVQPPYARLQRSRRVPGVVLGLLRPRYPATTGGVQRLPRQVQRRGRLKRRQQRHPLIILQKEFQQIGQQGPLAGVRARGAAEPFLEVARRDAGQPELEGVDDEQLHRDDLGARVRVVGDVRQLLSGGGVNLLVFTRQDHARAPQQLQLPARDFERRQASVDEVDHLTRLTLTLGGL